MKRLQFLSSVAASLLLAAGAAGAQSLPGSNSSGGAGTAPAAQRHAPPGKIAPSMHSRHKATETTGQAPAEQESRIERDHEKISGKHKGSSGAAQVKTREHSLSSTSGQASKDSGSATTPMEREGSKKNGSTARRSGTERATTGQGAAAGAAKLSTEQRSKITTIIKRKKVEPTQLNISVHVGARVPAHVHYYPLPPEVVTIYPEWRGYDYILVDDQILVVNPDTHLIVAVLEA